MHMSLPHETAGADLLFLREEQLRLAQTLMFLASRDMAQAVEPVLEEDGLGHAHYRVLQVLAFSPGIPVSRLQAVLGVTKQSLGRTMHELEARQYLESQPGRQDRRQRLLFLSPEGKAAEARLFAVVRQRLVAAYRGGEGPAGERFRRELGGKLREQGPDVLHEDAAGKKGGKDEA